MQTSQQLGLKAVVELLFYIRVDAVLKTKQSSTETDFPICGLKIRADYMDNAVFIQPKPRFKTKYLLTLVVLAQYTANASLIAECMR